MNNSFVLEQQHTDTKEIVSIVREEELLKLIGALEQISSSNYWKIISTWYIKELERVQNLLKTEKDTTEIFRLQGKISALERLSDLNTVTKNLKKELERITSNKANYAKESN